MFDSFCIGKTMTCDVFSVPGAASVDTAARNVLCGQSLLVLLSSLRGFSMDTSVAPFNQKTINYFSST